MVETQPPSAVIMSEMTLGDAFSIVLNAADNWCDYLEENARGHEIQPIEDAMANIGMFLKIIEGALHHE